MKQSFETELLASPEFFKSEKISFYLVTLVSAEVSDPDPHPDSIRSVYPDPDW